MRPRNWGDETPRQKLATSELAAASPGEMTVTQDRLEVKAERCSLGWEGHTVRVELLGPALQVRCGCGRKQVPGHPKNFGLNRGVTISRSKKLRVGEWPRGKVRVSASYTFEDLLDAQVAISHQQLDIEDWCPVPL